jgi:hypothetical protein
MRTRLTRRTSSATLRRAFQGIVDNLRLFADVPEEDILMTITETAGENWWEAGRVVNPTTGYDERMNDALAGAEATS